MPFGLEFTGNSDAVQRNFDKLDAFAMNPGRQITAVRFGLVAVHYPGASLSDATVVTHGLGVAPLIVLATVMDNGSTNNISGWQVSLASTTTFTLQGKTVDGSVIGPGNVTVAWLAIG